MKLDGGVDRFDLFGIHGWAADRDQPDATIGVDLLNNGERIATVPAAVLRPDLAAAGIGSGRHAFWLDPFEWLEYGENRLELRFTGTETALPEGGRTIYFDGLLVARFRAGGPVAGPAGYRRESVGGEAFLDALTRRLGAGALEGRNVLEVAPGDGRLLAAMRARGIRYRSYVGLETTSTGRAFQLVRRFGDRKTRFVHGSLPPGAAGPAPDVVLGLAAVEHLFPGLAPTLLGIRSRLAAGTPLCLGLPRVDAEMLVSAAWVEDVAAGGDFVRVYSRVELERLLGRCGLDVDAVDALGPPGDGSGIFVCARNTSRPPAPQAASALGPVVSGTAGTPAWLSRVVHAPRLQPILRRLDQWGAIGVVKRAVSAVRTGRP